MYFDVYFGYLSLSTEYVCVCVCARASLDKSAQMNEFISHIKMNTELATMFESVQRDTTMTTSETSLMDIS